MSGVSSDGETEPSAAKTSEDKYVGDLSRKMELQVSLKRSFGKRKHSSDEDSEWYINWGKWVLSSRYVEDLKVHKLWKNSLE